MVALKNHPASPPTVWLMYLVAAGGGGAAATAAIERATTVRYAMVAVAMALLATVELALF